MEILADVLKIDAKSSLLKPIRFLPSPHHDDRPSGTSIDMIVIHGISLPPGEFGSQSVETFFCGHLDFSSHPSFISIQNLRVSSHLFIKRTGEIIQFVPFSKRAWHAGQSFFMGKTSCNDFSIGIELEGTDELPYEKVQYSQLGQAVKLLMQHYPMITPNRIVGHVDIAPGRKTDPGPSFDWALLRTHIKENQ